MKLSESFLVKTKRIWLHSRTVLPSRRFHIRIFSTTSRRMARYSLQFKKSVTKDLRSIPKKDVRRILKRIGALADDPRPAGCEKLTTRELYRIRQDHGRGETEGLSQRTGLRSPVRILYQIHDDLLVVMVITVARRSDAY